MIIGSSRLKQAVEQSFYHKAVAIHIPIQPTLGSIL